MHASSKNLTANKFFIMYAATHLSEEDSDALQKLLQTASISLSSRYITIEKVQQLLFEKGHKDLAINLRARLDEGKKCVYSVLQVSWHSSMTTSLGPRPIFLYYN